MPSLTRRKFFQLSAAIAATGAFAVGADASIFEPDFPRLTNLEIPLARLPAEWDGLRIVQLSDFHYDEHFSAVPIRKAVAMVNALRADLILLTGDFVTVPLAASDQAAKAAADAIEPCVGLLSPLRARLGTFAALGNHDAGSEPTQITRTLVANGIPVLLNSSLALEQAGVRLWLAGVDDALEGKADLAAAIRGIPTGEPVILLAHEPDIALHVAKHPVDLQLSGHSHGGQIRLPWIGAPVLPDLGRLFPWGLHKIEKLMLYTNVGVGTIRLPIRFNCPPEITLITLRSGVAPDK